VQSSRRLEREAGRNVELMWLLGRLVPDHKTVADFRKDNGSAIRQVCARFVELCREMGLLVTASVAIDGSKFKAVNNRDRNVTRAKVERRRTQLEESVALSEPAGHGRPAAAIGGACHEDHAAQREARQARRGDAAPRRARGPNAGGGTGSGITVAVPGGALGIALRNGSITGFSQPVALGDPLGSIVERLRVIGLTALLPYCRRVRFWDIRATGIFAVGTVTGNYVTDSGEGIGIGAGSTVIGNTVRNSQVGFFVDCPSNVTDNTAAFNTTANLQLNGNGCNNTSNVAP
jgi:hypothetical protein